MKIRFTGVIEVDETKYPNLKQSEIRKHVNLTLESVIVAMEQEGYEMKHLEDLNAERDYLKESE